MTKLDTEGRWRLDGGLGQGRPRRPHQCCLPSDQAAEPGVDQHGRDPVDPGDIDELRPGVVPIHSTRVRRLVLAGTHVVGGPHHPDLHQTQATAHVGEARNNPCAPEILPALDRRAQLSDQAIDHPQPCPRDLLALRSHERRIRQHQLRARHEPPRHKSTRPQEAEHRPSSPVRAAHQGSPPWPGCRPPRRRSRSEPRGYRHPAGGARTRRGRLPCPPQCSRPGPRFLQSAQDPG